MDKKEIARKLCSRKLWMAVAGLITGIVVALSGDQSTAETVGGLIMATGSVVAYIAGEGFADGSH